MSSTVLTFLLLVSSSLPAQPPGRPASPAAGPPALLLNERHPLPRLLTGGAPSSPAGFQALADAGYRTYIDVRSSPEMTPETWAAAEAAGLRYWRIPVADEAVLDLGTARKLDGLLGDDASYPVVLACASGNRAAALLAVRAFWLDGASPEEALALGLRAGLTRLEPSVRLLLGLPPAAQR